MLCAGIKCLAPRFVGRKLSSITSNFAQTHRNFLGGQTRFMSPEVGAIVKLPRGKAAAQRGADDSEE